MEDPVRSPLLSHKTTRRSPLWACSFIIVSELVERISYYGISANLVLYMINVLRLDSSVAAQNVNNWAGTATMLPIVGAFVADSYLGKYLTIVFSAIVYAVGMILLTLSASVLKPVSCGTSDTSCPDATTAQLAVFFIALYSIAIGTGGVKPCLEAFGADQFDENDPVENRMKSSFFNWWYFGICMGALLAFTVIVYIEDNASWGLGYGIIAALIVIASVLFLAGTPLYTYVVISGNTFTTVAQVLTAAASKWSIRVPEDDVLLYEEYDQTAEMTSLLAHTKGLRCLDKAATITTEQQKTEDPSWRRDPWRLCTVTQVEEVKLIARLMPIWVSTIVYGVVNAQTVTFFVEQAATMDRKVGGITIPSASLLSFSSVAILVALPVYEWGLVPVARRWTGRERGVTVLQRLGVGLGLSVGLMVVAGAVEGKRLRVAEESGLVEEPTETVPMTVLWLVPQYILYGICDVFALVGQQELFYGQIGDGMRSVGMALFLCGNGLGSYAGSALISLVQLATNGAWIVANNLNQSRLDLYYYLLAVLCALNFLFYLSVTASFTYKTRKT